MSTTHSELQRKSTGQVVVLGDEQFARDRSIYEVMFKRPFDILITIVALTLLSPVLLGTWLAVRVMLGKGVLLTQERIGRNGEVFDMLKFRTMRHDRRASPDSESFAGEDRRQNHKSANDPRHTSLGRFLRGASIDELPQLINVLRGDMSIVGPRPEMRYVAKRDGITYHPRHVVRPGLTGAFQVSGLRSSEGLAQGLHLDLAYVLNLSFTSDLRIMLKTVGVLIKRTGA